MSSPGWFSAPVPSAATYPLPAVRFCLTLFAARGLFDSPEIHAWFALFFGQLCWQLLFPPSQGKGYRRRLADKFPCLSLCARHLSAQSVCASRATALFFGDVWLGFQLKFLPSSSSSSSGCQAQHQDWEPWADISELSKPTPSCESYCFCCFLQGNLLTSVCTNGPCQCSPAMEGRHLLE